MRAQVPSDPTAMLASTAPLPASSAVTTMKPSSLTRMPGERAAELAADEPQQRFGVPRRGRSVRPASGVRRVDGFAQRLDRGAHGRVLPQIGR